MTTRQIIMNANGIDRLIDHQATEMADWLWDDQRLERIDVLPVMSGCMYYAPTLLRRVAARRPGLGIRVVKDEGDPGWPKQQPSHHPLLVVDTIYDTGATAQGVLNWWTRYEPTRRVFFAFLIAKSRTPAADMGDKWWIGARVPEKYVFGYGLDDAEGLRRELPYICWEE